MNVLPVVPPATKTLFVLTPRGVTSVVAKVVMLAVGHSAEVGLDFLYDLSLSTTIGVFLIMNF